MPLACSVSRGLSQCQKSPAADIHTGIMETLSPEWVFKISNPSAVWAAVDDVLGHEGELTFDGGHGLTLG